MASNSVSDAKAMAKIGNSKWLNRNILGLGITRFFSDFSHECGFRRNKPLISLQSGRVHGQSGQVRCAVE